MTSSDPTELEVDKTVGFPAGESSVLFDLSMQDDELLDGTQTVEQDLDGDLTGRRFSPRRCSRERRRVSHADGRYQNGKGGQLPAESRQRAPGRAMCRFSVSDDPTEVTVPESITIPRGRTLPHSIW
jgi:hypothetical protein